MSRVCPCSFPIIAVTASPPHDPGLNKWKKIDIFDSLSSHIKLIQISNLNLYYSENLSTSINDATPWIAV